MWVTRHGCSAVAMVRLAIWGALCAIMPRDNDGHPHTFPLSVGVNVFIVKALIFSIVICQLRNHATLALR